VSIRAPASTGSSISHDVSGYLAEHHAAAPHLASRAGLHAFDGLAPDLSPSAVQRRIQSLERWGAQLRTAHPAAAAWCASAPLTTQDERDLALVEYARGYELFRWREWRQHERDPRFYQSAVDVTHYLRRPYAPLPERLEALAHHLGAVPDVLVAARANLRQPLARLVIEQAIHAYSALAAYYDGELRTHCHAIATGLDVLARVELGIGIAVAAIEAFVSDLREQLAEPAGDFRLGAGTLAGMVAAGELVSLSLPHLRTLAEADLAANHARAEAVAGSLGLSLADAFAALAPGAAKESGILNVAANAVAALRTELSASGVIDLEALASVECRVEHAPSTLGGSTAYMDAPGAFERPGLPAYFYISLPDPDWPEDVRANWLVHLHPWGLRTSAAHEAVPGHLLQFASLARHPSPAARTITSYAATEGWAHYAERLVIDCGGTGVHPLAELAQLRMALLRNCRVLAALDLHAGEASVAQAAELIARHTLLPPDTCRQSALRGTLDPGYLNYTLGKLLVLALRAEYQRQEGARYTPRRFHDALLACGAPPIPLARRMLLAAPTVAGDEP
jgi:uncharacterized protein (DUF885 family)